MPGQDYITRPTQLPPRPTTNADWRTGGWHDAGDYNKYVVNAGVTVGAMFLAWEQFGDKLKNIKLDIPDTAPGYPDYLKELKWEIDWLLKMQYPDGSGKVSHKVSTLRFGGFIMPEKETETRYFTGYSTAATADFVAMTAMAARNFKPYDEKYAQKCLDAAKKSYEFLMKHRENKMAGPVRHSGPARIRLPTRMTACGPPRKCGKQPATQITSGHSNGALRRSRTKSTSTGTGATSKTSRCSPIFSAKGKAKETSSWKI